MGNQPSKDVLVDSQRRIRPTLSNSKNQLDNRVSASKSSKLTSSKNKKEIQKNTISRPVIVSPVRHQLVLNDHVTPLVSLSAANISSGICQRRSSSTPYRDTRSMSTSSVTSEEWEPNTPTTYYSRSSYDEYAHSFMTDIQQKKLSSSLPVKHSDGFIINNTFQTIPATMPSHARRDSREIWVYEYGAEKERDR
jgi:hypothetical protein